MDAPAGTAETSAYAQGYEHGENSQLADWEFALMDVLPDDVEVRPSQVAAYIRRLQAARTGSDAST